MSDDIVERQSIVDAVRGALWRSRRREARGGRCKQARDIHCDGHFQILTLMSRLAEINIRLAAPEMVARATTASR